MEVAFGQDARKLGSDCARWTGASGGSTNMAIGIAIQNSAADNNVLESITVSVWTLRDFTDNDKKTRKRQCGFLRRIDGYNDEDSQSPLAFEYLFSTRVGKRGDIFTWMVGRTETKIMGPNGQQLEGSVEILNRHIYRDTGSPAWDQEIYVELRYSTIIEAVRQGHIRQVSVDIGIARSKKGKANQSAIDADIIRYNFVKWARLRELANKNLSQQAGTSSGKTRDVMADNESSEYLFPSDFYESDSDSTGY